MSRPAPALPSLSGFDNIQSSLLTETRVQLRLLDVTGDDATPVLNALAVAGEALVALKAQVLLAAYDADRAIFVSTDVL